MSAGATRAVERRPRATGQERKVLRNFARVLPELPIDDAVWRAAYDLSRRARPQGITVPATDVVIAACARRHGAVLESADTDFDLLMALEEPRGK